MLIDISPLRTNARYRLLFTGQFISNLGSMLTHVALPYQMYQLTHSSLYVGAIGLTQLTPLVFSSIVGGAYADVLNRRRLLFVTNTLFAGVLSLAAWNAHREIPSVGFLFAAAFLAGLIDGFHRTSLTSITPQIVPASDLSKTATLDSIRTTATQIAGPAVAGFIIAGSGVGTVFILDALSFVIALACIFAMGSIPNPSDGKKTASLGSILEGFRYARSRQELIGTYVVDFVAMIFGMPLALFPALSEEYGGAKVIGLFYAAPAVGALLASIVSGRLGQIHRQGRAITIAAVLWGIGIMGFGLTHSLWISLGFLMFAGAADMVSGVLRMVVWNRTIPSALRGRLAGIEIVSYTSGPLLGDAEAGFVAALSSVRFSVVSGGALCVVGVVACAVLLPKFWRYDEREFISL